ncbi:hypothetical protein EYF80_061355 [Liparis tanakae]|uniref:Uncharacterized protein n=1 Tax=Liparis tanakae TaxID=230148 RepID=A0A4Z2EIA5_9TELE|nr:hypothetical protein EYF80_061355 [Liparis tanakae]
MHAAPLQTSRLTDTRQRTQRGDHRHRSHATRRRGAHVTRLAGLSRFTRRTLKREKTSSRRERVSTVVARGELRVGDLVSARRERSAFPCRVRTSAGAVARHRLVCAANTRICSPVRCHTLRVEMHSNGLKRLQNELHASRDVIAIK